MRWPWQKKPTQHFTATFWNSCGVRTRILGSPDAEKFDALMVLANACQYGQSVTHQDAVDEFVAKVKAKTDEYWANL